MRTRKGKLGQIWVLRCKRDCFLVMTRAVGVESDLEIVVHNKTFIRDVVPEVTSAKPRTELTGHVHALVDQLPSKG